MTLHTTSVTSTLHTNSVTSWLPLPGATTTSHSPALHSGSPAVHAGSTALPADGNRCIAGEDEFCHQLNELIGNQHIAKWMSDQVSAILSSCLIIIGALLLLALARAVIARWTKRVAAGDPILGFQGPRISVPGLEDPLKGERRQQRAQAIGGLLRHTSTFLIVVVATLSVINQFTDKMAPLFTSAGILGVAIGFGSQSLIKDFMSGVFMIMEDQFGVGDVIAVSDFEGTVEAVGLRVTRVRDVEGSVWYIRNGEILQLANKSQGWSRSVLDVRVPYDCDISQAQAIMSATGAEMAESEAWKGVMLEKPQVWGVQDFGQYAVDVRIVAKTAPLEQWRVARELRERIKYNLDAAGIRMPTAIDRTVQEQGLSAGPGSGGQSSGRAARGRRAARPDSQVHEPTQPAATREFKPCHGERSVYTESISVAEARTRSANAGPQSANPGTTPRRPTPGHHQPRREDQG